jgi:hypothetical protein
LKIAAWVSTVLFLTAWAHAWLRDVRIVLVPPIGTVSAGSTILFAGIPELDLVTDVAALCIDPGAKIDEDELRLCSESVLLAISSAGTVFARMPHVAVLKEFAVT